MNRSKHSQHKEQLRGSVAPRMAQPTSTGEAFWRAFIEQQWSIFYTACTRDYREQV